ncbi:MAG: aldo/keto reductase [Oligoflexales bacterium]|nr:aldo/keto reductase [Oligoflexales bacterium]
MKMIRILILTISLLTTCWANEGKKAVTAVKSAPEMEYVTVCNTRNDCRRLSRLIMGTDHLVQGGWTDPNQPEITENDAQTVLDEAARLGINVFDTAPIYVGGVENKLGRWIQSRSMIINHNNFYYSPRSNPDRKLYALTKGGFPFDLFYSRRLEAGIHSEALVSVLAAAGILSPSCAVSDDGATTLGDVPPGTYASRLFGPVEQIVSRVSEEQGHSRSNLNDDITIYLMHRDDGDYMRFNEVPREKTPVETIMRALSDDSISSHFWALGWSNWLQDRVNVSLALANADSSLARPLFNSAYFSLFEMTSRTIHAGGVQVTHQEMNDPYFEYGIYQNPYSPLGGFSILDKPEPRWENAMRSAWEKYMQGDAYWQNVYHSIFTPENRARYERVVEFTNQYNNYHGTSYTIDQMLNAYALAHKRTSFLTVGPITIEQLRRTVGSLALSHNLTEADLEYLYSGRR